MPATHVTAGRRPRARLRRACAWLWIPCAFACATQAATLLDPGHGPIVLAPGTAGATELSGIAFAGADLYYAVSDAGPTLFELEVQIDPETAEILSAAVIGSIALASGSDPEGIVHHPLGGSVLVSDEVGPAIREYRLSDGAQLSTLALPSVFSNVRPNLSLESLSMRVAASASDDALWTANEEALSVDGAESTGSAGSTVRLQRFDAALLPDGQWAYVTDPYPGGPFLGQERSGVADLLALPNGELLVLERSFSSALFRARIYQVDFTGASDVSGIPGLAGESFTPVGKSLLWERAGTLENWEGIALGPPLDAGDFSLLLVSDDGAGATQGLYPLRISYLPEPGAARGIAAGLLGLAALRRRRPARP